MSDTLTRGLEEVLGPILGDVRVENLQALTGGASRVTWAFDAVTESRRRLILRTGAPDDIHAGMELEAKAQQRAAAAGAPVPHILTADNSPAALGSPYLICDAVAGETIVRRILRALDDATRARLLEQCATALAAIHRADPDGIGLTLPRRTRRLAHAARRDRRHHSHFRMGVSSLGGASARAVADAAGARRLPDGQSDRRRLRRLAAVLDWELTHIGEIYEDLAWFCIRAWRFGAPEAFGAGGLGSVEDVPAGLRTRVGDDPRPRRFSLVADGGDAAVGRDLPAPGRAAPVGRIARRSSLRRSGAGSVKPNGTYWI